MIKRLFVVSLIIILNSCSWPRTRLHVFPNAGRLTSSPIGRDALQKAEADVDLLERGQSPRYAQYKSTADDGSRLFFGFGYTLIDHKRPAVENGVHGKIVGQTVYFDPKHFDGRIVEYVNTRFVPGEG